MASNERGPDAAMAAADKEEEDHQFDELMDEDEDIDIVDDGSSHNAETNKFDSIVGCLQDILMDADFEQEREAFCRSHCGEFEDTEENKLVYTDIFSRYTALVERCIETKLTAAVPGFSMGEFMAMLDSRKDELVMEVFDLLLTMGDFQSFKEMMVDYRNEAAREAGGGGLRIDVSAVRLHAEDQEDGDLRSDLDTALMISPASGR